MPEAYNSARPPRASISASCPRAICFAIFVFPHKKPFGPFDPSFPLQACCRSRRHNPCSVTARMCVMQSQQSESVSSGESAATRPLRTLLPSSTPRKEALPTQSKRARISLACAACRTRKTKVSMYCILNQINTAKALSDRSFSAMASVRRAANARLVAAPANIPRRRLRKRNENTSTWRSCSNYSNRYPTTMRRNF